jgi:hypothetical protein
MCIFSAPEKFGMMIADEGSRFFENLVRKKKC